jgi:hypothetical protein
MKTLVTDGFDGEEDLDRFDDDLRNAPSKEMTEKAKRLDEARRVYRINKKGYW